MAYNYEYPYTDPHIYNDDWVLHTVKRVDDEMDKLPDTVEEIVIRNLDKTFLDVLYQKSDKRIVLKPKIIADGTHVYDFSQKAIIINGGD